MDNLDRVLQEIKDGTKKQFGFSEKIHLSDLMKTDEDGIPYLEYACRNRINFSFNNNLSREIITSREAIIICCKNKHVGWIISIYDEELLFEDVNENEKIIDLIFSNYSKGSRISWTAGIKKHPEIMDYLVKYDLIGNISSTIMDILFEEKDGACLIDKYINTNAILPIVGQYITNQVVSFEKLYKYCKSHTDYSLFKYAKEEYLLHETEDGKTILEVLLESHIEPLFFNYSFKDEKIANTLINNNKSDLLVNASIDILLSSYDENKTYFDFMIEAYKNGADIDFDMLPYWSNSIEDSAKLLILMAKNNIIGYIPEIDDKLLLRKDRNENKMLIEYLLEMDRDITLNTIIPRRLFFDKKFVFILKTIDVEKGLLDEKHGTVQYSDKFIAKYNHEYVLENSREHEELLSELYQLFTSDGISDKEIVEALVTSYQYFISANEELALLEIKQLIAIKKKNPNFGYLKTDPGGFFSKGDGCVHVNSAIISTLNHETGHALHYYLADSYIPDEFFQIVKKVSNNPETLLRVKEYAKQYIELRSKLRASLPKKEISDYYDEKYSGDELIELVEFLIQSKEKKKEEYKDKISDIVLDTILAKSYSVDEFIRQRKELEEEAILDAKFRNDYDAFIAIGDIIDAIYLGKYRNGVLMDENRSYIDPAYGHGIAYYSMRSHGFDEMVANYSQILKSKNSDQIMRLLRYIVGDELVDMLANFYENKILRSKVVALSLDEEIDEYGI